MGEEAMGKLEQVSRGFRRWVSLHQPILTEQQRSNQSFWKGTPYALHFEEHFTKGFINKLPGSHNA